MIDLSIIIVSWQVKNLLSVCLASIFKYTQGLNFEVFVVDNASADGSAEMVKHDFPQVKLIANQSNTGFAFANNQALRQANGRFILLLNPDTEFFDDSLSRMVELMKRHPDWSIAGCQILNPDKTIQPSVRRFPDWLTQALILLKFHHTPFFKKKFNHYLMFDFDYQLAACQVDQIMGAFFMFRRELLERLGFLDDKFFYWFEEVDYCYQARLAGLKTFYTAQARVIHHGAASFRQLDWRKQLVWHHSLEHYFSKHKPFWQFLILWLLRPLGVCLALLAALFKKKSS